MPKGVGNKKRKQPTKWPAPKRPASAPSAPGGVVGVAGQKAILDQLEALERAHGLPLSGLPAGAPAKKGRVTRQSFQNDFYSQVHQRLLSVATRAMGAVAQGSGGE